MTENVAAAACLAGERAGFRWYHVENPKGKELDELATQFGLHELAIEDCRNLRQRAKVEEYDGCLFLVANTLHFDSGKEECWFAELDVFVGKDFLISVHDGPSRTITAVKPKFAADPRLAHPGRLLQAMLDIVVDRYLPVLDTIEDRIEELEDRAYEQPSPKLLAEIFRLKRALIDFRRVATAMRDLLNALLYRNEHWLRTQQAYFRNIYDHVVRALDFVETYRDILTGVLDVHLTATANRTNEIMKVLTIWATVALPLFVITSYFGMNFPSLPLVNLRHGLAYLNAGMAVLGLALLWMFRRRGWF